MSNPQQPAADSNWKRPFFMVWTAQGFSLIGSGLVQFALVWWLTQTTGSAIVLATATFMAVIPDVFLGPFAGALVDRWNRRLVMMVFHLPKKRVHVKFSEEKPLWFFI
jgi:DHA3 family macrolide efflux protein-like MFS transporter